MALVAYDNSDSSDYDDEENDNTPVQLLTNKIESKKEAVLSPPTIIKEEEPEAPSLFNLLPQPSSKKPVFTEEDDEFLHKKADQSAVKPKAKITVPSLSDFKDVEPTIPSTKPKAASGKKSGLLSMLPQPRNGVTTSAKSLIPNILTKKSSPAVKKPPLPSPSKQAKINPTPLINNNSDDSDNEEVQNDFFSINKPVELPPVEEIPADIEPQAPATSVPQRTGLAAFFKPEPIVEAPVEASESMEEDSVGYVGFSAENMNSHEVALDEEALMKLVGSRGKRKREEIQIVDIKQDEVLGNAREMLMKGLMDDTTKRVSASKKKGNEPTSQQRRKHQITYLAYQAKANEAELQNQWANNRMSKRQTQAKYGF